MLGNILSRMMNTLNIMLKQVEALISYRQPIKCLPKTHQNLFITRLGFKKESVMIRSKLTKDPPKTGTTVDSIFQGG